MWAAWTRVVRWSYLRSERFGFVPVASHASPAHRRSPLSFPERCRGHRLKAFSCSFEIPVVRVTAEPPPPFNPAFGADPYPRSSPPPRRRSFVVEAPTDFASFLAPTGLGGLYERRFNDSGLECQVSLRVLPLSRFRTHTCGLCLEHFADGRRARDVIWCPCPDLSSE